MLFDCNQLVEFIKQVALKSGMNEKEAYHFANSLVSADKRGLSSHGVMRIAAYMRRIKEGLICVNTEPILIRDGNTMLAFDGMNGMGCTIAESVMEFCTDRAKDYGACFASVSNCNHFGYAGYFAKKAAEKGMIAIAMTNAAATMAPFGGTKAMLGTNPLCVALPANSHSPVMLDMATSLVAQGKLILAQKEGREVPVGWGLDKDGKSCTDPARILNGGTLTSFGGAKGYGITLLIEMLTVGLSGAAKSTNMGKMYDYTRTQNTGFFMGALDIEKMIPLENFTAAVDELIDEMKNTPKAEDVNEIFVPGEIEDQKELLADTAGISLSSEVYADLMALSEEYGVPLTCVKG